VKSQRDVSIIGAGHDEARTAAAVHGSTGSCGAYREGPGDA
jgi:hypothetical protein